jgi:hypothetical protein
MIPRKVGKVRRRMRPSEAPPPGAKASAGLQPLFGDPTNDWVALYQIAPDIVAVEHPSRRPDLEAPR